MMRRRYKRIGIHPCQIEFPDCWPRLKPRANWYTKFVRLLRSGTLPTYYHPEAKYIFKSMHTFTMEKNRMVYESSPFVAHPMSMFAIIRSIVVFIFVYFYVFVETFRIFFRLYRRIAGSTCIFSKFMQLLIVSTRFLVGYQAVDNEHKYMEVRLSRIALRYIRTHFFIDVLDLLRPCLIYIESEPVVLWLNFAIFHVYLVSRLKRTRCWRWVLRILFGFRLRSKYMVWYFSAIIFSLHYFTCFRYGMPRMIDIMCGTPGVFAADPDPDMDSKRTEYLKSMYMILLMFLLSSRPYMAREMAYEECVDCICQVLMGMLRINVLVYVLMTVTTVNNAEIKYGYMWNNIFNYMNSRNISGKLRSKIKAHYEYKFQNKYFDEASIINGLSTHLQYENLLHTCSHLMVNVDLLHGLPKSVVGRVIADLRPVVFLPNDVIIRWNTNFDCIYFVSYGTVASYNSIGKEVQHLEDGELIGSIGYYAGINYLTVTAVTITELYKWDASQMNQLTTVSPELLMRLKTLGKKRLDLIRRLDDGHTVANGLPRLDKIEIDRRMLREPQKEVRSLVLSI